MPIVTSAVEGGVLSDRQAIEILDIIMYPEGKGVIAEMYPDTAATVIQGLHTGVSAQLGAGYWPARLHRSIAGNHAVGAEK